MSNRVSIGFALAMALAVSASIARPSSASAQITRADSAAVVLETAQTFEARGRWDVAEALYRLLVERFPDTAGAAVARQRLAAPPDDVRFGDGRVALQVWSTLYGAWLGVAIPGALGADSPEPYGVGLLLGGPTGFVAGRRIARSTEMTEGQASAVSLGAWWGTWQGFGWQEVFELGLEEQCDSFGCYTVEDSDEEVFAAMILGGAVGITAGALLSRRQLTPGTGTAMNFGPLWGTWFGVAGGVLMDLEDDDLLAATLLGGNAGLVATALLAPGWNVSRSRVRLVSIAGVIGGLGGAGIDLLTQPDDEKVAIAIPLLGSIAGLMVGMRATRDRAATPDDGDRPFEGPAGALLTLRDGRLSLGAPIPTPALVASGGPDGHGWRSVLRVELFSSRF